MARDVFSEPLNEASCYPGDNVISFSQIAENRRREEQKEELFDRLDDLFWSNPVAYHELCSFCESRRFKIRKRHFNTLKRLGFLEKYGELPDITNEVVYEATTGKKPFWI